MTPSGRNPPNKVAQEGALPTSVKMASATEGVLGLVAGILSMTRLELKYDPGVRAR